MNKEYLIKRTKSLLWNLLSVAIVAILTMVVEPEFAQEIGLSGLGLVMVKELLAQLTKTLNRK